MFSLKSASTICLFYVSLLLFIYPIHATLSSLSKNNPFPLFTSYDPFLYLTEKERACIIEDPDAPFIQDRFFLSVSVSNQTGLFPLHARWLNIGGRQWQATGDGQQFLIDELIPEETPAPRSLDAVVP